MIYFAEFPLDITILSSGLAAEKQQDRMGDYKMFIKTVRDRPVWKKTDRDNYIFYDGIRFILL